MKRPMKNLIILTTLTASALLLGCESSNQDQSTSEPASAGSLYDDIFINTPSWAELNDQIIAEENVAIRRRDDITPTGIESNIGDGVVSNLQDQDPIILADGVEARVYSGSGNIMSWITMEPNSEMPASTIEGERFLFVMEGEAQELANGEHVTLVAVDREEPNGVSATMPVREFIYLQEGAETHVIAGENGATVFTVHAPIPRDALEALGRGEDYVDVNLDAFPLDPNVEPNMVYDLYDFQYTTLVPGAEARLVNGQGTQMSWLRMYPGIEFAYHNHPEEQVMMGLRGMINEYILDDTVPMRRHDVVNFPAYMVHGGLLSSVGSDALDVFFPPRTDYYANMERRLAGYHEIIPEGVEAELVVDGAEEGPGLNFTEGPAWLNGKLYFSNMYFDAAFNGDPSRSALVEMDPDGTYRYISDGEMQTNGVIPAADGENLLVADMFGHRVIEMTTDGEVVDTLADSYDGTSVDGPNDLVLDSKGGIYFSDPQFTADAEKFQPGRTVYYRNPEGEVIRLLPYDEFAMPNGVILSPDEQTLYINNTYDHESWWNVRSDKENFVWAYDVNEDGTISNGRAFAQLHLTGAVLDREARTSGADGMAVDTDGNLYVATYAGLQIFNSDGDFVGMVNMPTVPVSVTFGGEDFSTLYITSYDKIYSVQTNKTGYQLPNHTN